MASRKANPKGQAPPSDCLRPNGPIQADCGREARRIDCGGGPALDSDKLRGGFTQWPLRPQ
jgi:hypothetical protein